MRSFLFYITTSLILGILLYVSIRDQNAYFVGGGIEKKLFPKSYFVSIFILILFFSVTLFMTFFEILSLLKS